MQHLHPTAANIGLWLNKPAPRYTSYPPATAFQDGMRAEAYTQSLKDNVGDTPISAYIHIPFCHELCLYCGCHTSVTRRADRVDGYVNTLIKEIKILGKSLQLRPKLGQLHFGGGTPNILTTNNFADLFSELQKTFAFQPECEIAVELDPRHVTDETVHTLATHGVNRVSLGVQTFDSHVQTLINRIQPMEMVQDVCKRLRHHGITRINVDLMYGLPGQGAESVAETARQVVDLNPDRIALFSYAHVPSIKPHQKPLEKAGLPDAIAKLEMECAARNVLTAESYHPIGMDHFAKAGDDLLSAFKNHKLRRNFQGYTTDASCTLLSFGASSISQTPDGYFQNIRDTRAYQDCVTEGKLPINRGFCLTPANKLHAAIIEELMCYATVDVAEICKTFGKDPATLLPCLDTLKPLIEGELVVYKGYRLTLNTPYPMAIRAVALAFDEFTPQMHTVSSRVA